MLLLSKSIGNYLLWQWVVLLSVLIPAALRDLFEKQVHIFICLAGFLAGVVARLVGFGDDFTTFYGIIPGVVLLLTSVISREAIGYADGLVMIAIGMTTGIEAGLAILLYSLVFSSVVSLLLLVTKKAGRSTELPFVPFILIAVIGVGIL